MCELDYNTRLYKALQKLKIFVTFVKELPIADHSDKFKCDKIISILEAIDKPNAFQTECCCLDIYDRKKQNDINMSEGVYWRTWSIWFETDCINIEAKSNITTDPLGYFEEHFYCDLWISMNPETENDITLIENTIDTFVADALNFQYYITDTLNDVELDIEL